MVLEEQQRSPHWPELRDQRVGLVTDPIFTALAPARCREGQPDLPPGRSPITRASTNDELTNLAPYRAERPVGMFKAGGRYPNPQDKYSDLLSNTTAFAIRRS